MKLMDFFKTFIQNEEGFLATAAALGIGAGAAALGVGAGVAGAISASTPKTNTASQTSQLILGAQSAEQKQALANQQAAYQALGQGNEEDKYGLNAIMADIVKSGGMPNAQQVGQANQFAQQIFDPQRLAQQQAFTSQREQANQQAAVMGRSGNDPILQAKLAQQQLQQGAMLTAQQGAYAGQIGMQMPQNQFAMAGQYRQQEQATLAQAQANRLAIFNASNSMAQQQNQLWAMQGLQQQTGSQTQSGGSPFAGFMQGLAGGLSAGGQIQSGANAGGASYAPMQAPKFQPVYTPQSGYGANPSPYIGGVA